MCNLHLRSYFGLFVAEGESGKRTTEGCHTTVNKPILILSNRITYM